MKKIFSLLLVLATLSFFSPHSMAEEGYVERVGAKVINGVANMGTGFLEIPKTVRVSNQAQGPFYAATAGLFKGFWYSVCRTGFGILDVATFMFPGPVNPAMTPKLIWQDFDNESVFGPK